MGHTLLKQFAGLLLFLAAILLWGYAALIIGALVGSLLFGFVIVVVCIVAITATLIATPSP